MGCMTHPTTRTVRINRDAEARHRCVDWMLEAGQP